MLREEDRKRVVVALQTFEHGWLGLPAPHRVLYLDCPPDLALLAMQADGSRGGKLDMHETAGLEYKKRVHDTFLWCCSTFPEWVRVACVAETAPKPCRLDREEVHRSIYALLRQDFVNRQPDGPPTQTSP